MLAANKKYKDLCKLIADTSKQDNEETTHDVIESQDELKRFINENRDVKVFLKMMTILYGPIGANVFQYTSSNFFGWLPRLSNFILIFYDIQGRTNIVLLDKKHILQVFPEFGEFESKEESIRYLLKIAYLPF